jgi:uncharacterized protein YacL
MNITIPFIRFFFLLMCMLFFTAYMTTPTNGGFNYTNITFGLLFGIFFGMILISIDFLCKRFNLRAFNTALLGLFFGYLMGQALNTIFSTALNMGEISISTETASLIRIGVFLFSAYLGMIITSRSAEEIYMSIPFVEFKTINKKKKDSLLDLSTLADSRILDLVSSGLLDHNLIVPRFSIRELKISAENFDDSIKSKSRKGLEILKKIESISTLEIRYSDIDFPEVKDSMTKLVRLARFLDANIITADSSKIQSSIDGIKIINIQILSNVLKPSAQAGEQINIIIQRLGKDPRQGVGYLDDGTMVVVNGGAEFLGKSIKAQVLSFNQTTSGRMMIFCNAVVNDHLPGENDFMLSEADADMQNSEKSYFSI